MKKLLLPMIIILIISLAACQQAKEPVMEKKTDVMEKTPITGTGEAVVDAVGNDLTNVDTVEKDLSTDELSDLDSGFENVQNI